MEEEVEVVNSIYEGCLDEWAENIYTVHLPDTSVVFRMSFNDYPSQAPTIYDAGPWQAKFQDILCQVFIPGEQVIFPFISEVKEMVECNPQSELVPEQNAAAVESKGSLHANEWAVSEEIRDRGSTFVGRCIKVNDEQQAMNLIADILQDKRLTKANHNMTAYRIIDGDFVTRNCDDDGETAAGSRILHLLDITDSKNVAVVVSRWFGGTHIGPARFKHINACARDALIQGKFINN